ncbi:MAG: chemotaxis response regulator protein-glutamate methylesterase [Thermoplasmata archaeon]|nr:chemotaxis response regulator protein-glutamate methylesterase [Thermoplasmata archaeon]
MGETIRVLVVDDSKVMRKLLTDMLEQDKDIEVIGTARNGMDALDQIQSLRPDVVTMDIEMPKMDGLTALQHIMSENPLPVIILSAMDKRQADITMKALDLGAIDFVSKTSGTLSLDIDKIGANLIAKVKIAAEAKLPTPKAVKIEPIILQAIRPKRNHGLVIMGASTGGPKAISEVISRLPRDMPCSMIIIQHMPKGFTKSFAERLNWYTSIEVKEAEDGDLLKPGRALVAPGDSHLEVKKGRIKLTKKPKINYVRPSVDVTMKTAAKAYGANCIGVLLTGMGSDGAEGMKAIKTQGGRTIAQDEETSIIYGMPKAAADLSVTDRIRPLGKIAREILNMLEETT